MPKAKPITSVRLKTFVKLFGENQLETDDRVLMCRICSKRIGSDRKEQVSRHISSAKHQELLRRRSQKQKLYSTASAPVEKHVNSFFYDLCSAFMSANIPLHKLKNGEFCKFLEKYTEHTIPDESTLRKGYIRQLYERRVADIRRNIGTSNIWYSVDETTDSTGSLVANFVVGVLSTEFHKNVYLLNSERVDKANSETVAKFVVDSLNLLWEGTLHNDRVHLAVTDGASYMLKVRRL